MGAILLTFAVTLCLARSWAAADGLFRSSSPPLSQEAYVTLVYGEDFVLAARVLGQSLRESGSKKWVGQLARLLLPGFAPCPAMILAKKPIRN